MKISPASHSPRYPAVATAAVATALAAASCQQPPQPTAGAPLPPPAVQKPENQHVRGKMRIVRPPQPPAERPQQPTMGKYKSPEWEQQHTRGDFIIPPLD